MLTSANLCVIFKCIDVSAPRRQGISLTLNACVTPLAARVVFARLAQISHLCDGESVS